MSANNCACAFYFFSNLVLGGWFVSRFVAVFSRHKSATGNEMWCCTFCRERCPWRKIHLARSSFSEELLTTSLGTQSYGLALRFERGCTICAIKLSQYQLAYSIHILVSDTLGILIRFEWKRIDPKVKARWTRRYVKKSNLTGESKPPQTPPCVWPGAYAYAAGRTRKARAIRVGGSLPPQLRKIF